MVLIKGYKFGLIFKKEAVKKLLIKSHKLQRVSFLY